MSVTLIFASTPSGIIGNKGRLPWPPLKGELLRFRNTTMFGTVIMGRKTFDSLPKGPLSLRNNIVLTTKITLADRWKSFKYNLFHLKSQLEYVTDIDKAIFDYANEEIYLIGGAEIYKQFESKCDRMIWTKVNNEYEGDTKFIPSQICWQKTSSISYQDYKILYFKRKF